MPAHTRTVSHHMLRRTARKRERALERIQRERLTLEPGARRYTYRVEKASRGFRWRVVERVADGIRVNPIVIGDDGRPTVERYRFGDNGSPEHGPVAEPEGLPES